MRRAMEIFQDEQDGFSMSRTLVCVWTVVIIYHLLFRFDHLTQPILTFLSSVYLFLCTWAAGPRMVQYLAPIVGRVASAVGQAKSVETSTDIQELWEAQQGISQNTEDTDIG